jgi:aminoglycoside phosphotransferase (APT) family kinase protein
MTSASEDDVLHDAARTVGLQADAACRLWRHATTVYLLPTEQIIVRVSEGAEAAGSADRAVAVTRWLRSHDFSTVEPVAVEQPLQLDKCTVTFWRYYPQGGRPQPQPALLGELLRELHRLPAPPITLPDYQPLANFGATVTASTSLTAEEQRWLLAERVRLLETYGQLDFPLGIGHIHGDAYPGNVLWNGDQAILGDWDETAVGPRELDLANTFQGVRFGRTAQQLQAFAQAYGYDMADWPGLSTLRAMRDLHTLGSYIRRAGQGEESAAKELQYRLATLKDRDTAASWRAH